jgi:purine-cytosine permease-like protein
VADQARRHAEVSGDAPQGDRGQALCLRNLDSLGQQLAGGWNVPVVVAWAVGGLFGLLAVNTTLYVGPLADVAGGVDVSTIGSAALAGLIYLASPSVIKA